MEKTALNSIGEVVKDLADHAVSASARMRQECLETMEIASEAIKRKDAEIAALRAQLEKADALLKAASWCDSKRKEFWEAAKAYKEARHAKF